MDLKPIAGTKSCENHHLGYALSGALEVRTDAGDGLIIRGGSVYEIPPGHDAWVVGDEPFVTVEWTSGRLVGVAPEGPGDRVLATVLFTDIVDSTATLVHAAARILAIAGPDEVVVSDTTRDLVEGSGLAFEDAGRHALKGLTGERQLYRLASR